MYIYLLELYTTIGTLYHTWCEIHGIDTNQIKLTLFHSFVKSGRCPNGWDGHLEGQIYDDDAWIDQLVVDMPWFSLFSKKNGAGFSIDVVEC